jgi:hypothetical protein
LVESIDALDGARVESLDQALGRIVVRHDERQDRAALESALQAHGFPVREFPVRERGVAEDR